MGPRRCKGFIMENGDVMECVFNPHESGQKAQGKFAGRCMWCSPARLGTMCKYTRQQKLAAHFLVSLRDFDQSIFNMAGERVSAHENGDVVVGRANAILSERMEKVTSSQKYYRRHMKSSQIIDAN